MEKPQGARWLLTNVTLVVESRLFQMEQGLVLRIGQEQRQGGQAICMASVDTQKVG